MPRSNFYTEEDDELIRKYYPDLGAKKTARLLKSDRTDAQVAKRAKALKIKRVFKQVPETLTVRFNSDDVAKFIELGKKYAIPVRALVREAALDGLPAVIERLKKYDAFD